MEEKNYNTDELKHQFNSPEKAKKVREYNEVSNLNKTIENKNKNLTISIVAGILVLVLLGLAVWLTVFSITAGCWASTGIFANWIIGGMFVGLALIPAGVAMAFQYFKLIPLLKLLTWKKEGTYDYEFTKKDKLAFGFAVLTYIVFVIVRLALKVLILLASEK